jgi:CYTH domain-containing protein
MEIESKYTRVEYERRFLVASDSGWEKSVRPYSKLFEDIYLSNTRLRLRTLTDSDSYRRVIKLTKKAPSESPYFRTISRILLSQDEYDTLSRLDGNRIMKVRHYCDLSSRIFSIDVFQGELEGLILSEVESDDLDDLMSIEPPAFAAIEVTKDPFFDGGNLSAASAQDLDDKLADIFEKRITLHPLAASLEQ